MISNDERREVAKLLRERAGYDMGCVFKELYGDCNSAGPTCGECNERAMRYVADLLDPPDYLEMADEDAAEYADAETMQDERSYKYQARIGNVVLESNNGYDLLDAMLEMGA